MKPKLYTSEQWLRVHYLQLGESITQMAKACNVSEMTIRTALKKAKLIR